MLPPFTSNIFARSHIYPLTVLMHNRAKMLDVSVGDGGHPAVETAGYKMIDGFEVALNVG